jgi:hypothetical protein
MQAIARSGLFLVWLTAGALPAAAPNVLDTLGDMTAALSDNNVAGFMKPIDPEMPDYGKLKNEVAALLNGAVVASSIEVLKDEGDDSQHTLDLDWFMEIHPPGEIGALVHRRQVVQCKLLRWKKGWRLISLSPIEFFAPVTFDKNTDK